MGDRHGDETVIDDKVALENSEESDVDDDDDDDNDDGVDDEDGSELAQFEEVELPRDDDVATTREGQEKLEEQWLRQEEEQRSQWLGEDGKSHRCEEENRRMIDLKNKVEEKRQRRGKHLYQQCERERTLQKRIGQQEVVLVVSNETQHRDDDQLVSSCWDNRCCMRPLRHRSFAEEEKRLCKESGFCPVLGDYREESLVEQIEHYQDLHE